MKKNSLSKKKKVLPDDGRTVSKDEAGHVIEKLYGVHIIGPGDIEHHLGNSGRKSDSKQKRKTESTGLETKSESKKTKSNDDSNDIK